MTDREFLLNLVNDRFDDAPASNLKLAAARHLLATMPVSSAPSAPGRAVACSHQVSTDATNAILNMLRLMGAGRKIEAIKQLRELTGLGLVEAKNGIELVMR